jgi:hypothetical protein
MRRRVLVREGVIVVLGVMVSLITTALGYPILGAILGPLAGVGLAALWRSPGEVVLEGEIESLDGEIESLKRQIAASTGPEADRAFLMRIAQRRRVGYIGDER